MLEAQSWVHAGHVSAASLLTCASPPTTQHPVQDTTHDAHTVNRASQIDTNRRAECVEINAHFLPTLPSDKSEPEPATCDLLPVELSPWDGSTRMRGSRSTRHPLSYTEIPQQTRPHPPGFESPWAAVCFCKYSWKQSVFLTTERLHRGHRWRHCG